MNILSLYRFYNYKLKFIERVNKNVLFKNQIYLILKYKFEQVKKYSNEHLKKKIHRIKSYFIRIIRFIC